MAPFVKPDTASHAVVPDPSIATICSNLDKARLSNRQQPKFVRNLTILYDSRASVCDDRATQKPAEE